MDERKKIVTTELAKSIFSKLTKDEINELVTVLSENSNDILHNLQILQREFQTVENDPIKELALYTLSEIKSSIEQFGSYSFQAYAINEYTAVKEISSRFGKMPFIGYLEIINSMYGLNEKFSYCSNDYIYHMFEEMIRQNAYKSDDDERYQLATLIQNDNTGYLSAYEKQELIEYLEID